MMVGQLQTSVVSSTFSTQTASLYVAPLPSLYPSNPPLFTVDDHLLPRNTKIRLRIAGHPSHLAYDALRGRVRLNPSWFAERRV
jgi:hypothetical protein